jgi:transketolase
MNNSENNIHKTSEELALFVKKSVVNMTSVGNSSHVGSCLSISDILSVLYFDFLKIHKEKSNRDIFILSKGHAGAALYATLAGIGIMNERDLLSHYQNGSVLSGHVSHKACDFIEFSTGSLGHGLPVATGFALGFKLDKKNNKVVCLLSDGELDEGSNWEAILFAAHHKLNNLTVIIDYNKIQSLGSVESTLGLEPLTDKFLAFNCEVYCVDGHNHKELKSILKIKSKKPKVIIANTTKGKGVSFMEDSVLWHYRSPQGDEYKNAINELNKK